MEFDRQRFGHDSTFSQLFVSRSSRLCKYVKEAVCLQAIERQNFMTFLQLTCQLESSLSQVEAKQQFVPSQHVNFYRFQREFYDEKSMKVKGGSLLVWKSE